MDLWVVAAVAGAGCLAKYLNKLSKNGDSSVIISSEDSNFENPGSPVHPICKRTKRGKLGNDASLDRRPSDVNSLDGPLTRELDSNKGLDNEIVRPFRNCNESDVLSVSNLNDVGYGNDQSSYDGGNCGFLLPNLSAGKLGHNICRTKRLYGHISRPSNSLESCLMSQLCNCKEHTEMEEFVSSLSMATSSSLVSDESQMISGGNDDDSFSGVTRGEEYRLHLHREANKVGDGSVLFGVPSLPKIGSFNDAKKMKFNARNGQSGAISPFNNVISGNHILTQHYATFLFSLGISFGIITSIFANKRETDKLGNLLKQTENLVQDLQEELEMRDSMTVKELHSENYGSQDTCDHSFCDKELNGFSSEKHMDNSPMSDCKKAYDQKEEESSESMRKIEAELEAELERLGLLNMNESSPERPLSEVEHDPDFIADFAQSELQTDLIGGKELTHSELNEDANDTLIPVNYAVSPYELSLRLHEVIQSRLEEHVKELEFALRNSQRKLWLLETKHESHSQKYFSRCGQASSFPKENLLTYDDCDPTHEPLVMNLSVEVLGAYNDTCEDITKTDDFRKNSPSGIIHNTNYKVDSQSHDLHVLGVQHCGANDLLTYSTANEERLSRELSSGEVTMLEGQSSSIYESNDDVDDENCECNYEVERHLIWQIVERTRKGSPVLENARRILYSMDEDEC
ncbi:hypothetical protein RJT34_33488 [Clitoria ternatea]|uniref:Uncharacterized protein n=1 Tax=Clitoria ternatea TaxID=43366 RepID=A0AAN9EZG0_CLITE